MERRKRHSEKPEQNIVQESSMTTERKEIKKRDGVGEDKRESPSTLCAADFNSCIFCIADSIEN